MEYLVLSLGQLKQNVDKYDTNDIIRFCITKPNIRLNNFISSYKF